MRKNESCRSEIRAIECSFYLKGEGDWLEKEGGFLLIDEIEDVASMGILIGFA